MNTQALEAKALKLDKAAAFRIKGETIEIGRCVAGGISANGNASIGNALAVGVAVGGDLTLGSGGAQFLAVGRDLNIQQGGGQFISVGNNFTTQQGGGQLVIVGNDFTTQKGGAMIAAAGQMNAANAFIGVALAGRLNLSENSRVLITTPQVALIGLLAGAVITLCRLFLRRASS